MTHRQRRGGIVAPSPWANFGGTAPDGNPERINGRNETP